MSGGCLCGAVRYTASGGIKRAAICHCRHCQKQSGTAFSVVVAVARECLSIRGQTKSFQNTGDSGFPVHRVFCPECGSPLFSTTHRSPDLIYVKVGSLDDTSMVSPTFELYRENIQLWLRSCDFRIIPAK